MTSLAGLSVEAQLHLEKQKNAQLQLLNDELMDKLNKQNKPQHPQRPPKPVGLKQLSNCQQNRVTDNLVAEVDKILGERKDTNVKEVLGVIIRRLMYHDDRAIANIGIALLDGKAVCARRKLSVEECLNLITRHKMRERGWT